jgi:hypothetical protein
MAFLTMAARLGSKFNDVLVGGPLEKGFEVIHNIFVITNQHVQIVYLSAAALLIAYTPLAVVGIISSPLHLSLLTYVCLYFIITWQKTRVVNTRILLKHQL